MERSLIICTGTWKAARGYPDSNVLGANMGSTWVLSAPDGPHVGPLNLAIRDIFDYMMMQWRGYSFSHYWSFVIGIHQSPVDTHKGPVVQRFDIFFLSCLDEPLSKQSSCQWSDTSWRSCDVIVSLSWRVYVPMIRVIIGSNNGVSWVKVDCLLIQWKLCKYIFTQSKEI